jgi:hypothetical protein
VRGRRNKAAALNQKEGSLLPNLIILLISEKVLDTKSSDSDIAI